MIDVTDVLRNFQAFLRGSWPSVSKAGIEVGDDEWDDLVEVAFDVLVINPIRERHGVTVDWAYASWPDVKRSVRKQGTIVVRIPADSEILAAKPTNSDESNVYFQTRISEDIRFALREFSHPFMKGSETEDSFNYVTGEIDTDDAPLPPGTRLCVTLNLCRFVVRRANAPT